MRQKLFLIPLLAAGTLRAETLTWETSLAEAARANADLVAAREALNQAKANLKSGYADFLPQISLSADYSAAESGTRSGETDEGIGVGINARQNLFAGLADRAAVEGAKADLAAAQARLDDARATVSADLKRAYGNLLYTQESLALSAAIAERRQANVRLVALRYESGRENKGSLLRSEANHAQAQFELGQARRSLRLSERDLATVLGRDRFDALRATGTLTINPVEKAPAFEALLRATPAYRLAEAALRGARANVTSAKSNIYPDLTASAGITRRGDPWTLGLERWSAGLSLSLPMFSGGRTYFGVKAALAAARASEAALAATYRATAGALESDWAGFADAAERTRVQQLFLEAAQVRSEIARGQYTNGLLSFQDWDQIENDLINAQKSWLASRRDAVFAEAAWDERRGQGAIP